MIHGGDIEPVTRGSSRNAGRVRLIVDALSDRSTGEHFQTPGVIGSVIASRELDPILDPLEDGTYREIALYPILERTDLGQLEFDNSVKDVL